MNMPLYIKKLLMKMNRKEIKMNTTVNDKLITVNDNFYVNMYDNGFMVEVNGTDKDGEYKTVKLICNSLSELNTLIASIVVMERE